MTGASTQELRLLRKDPLHPDLESLRILCFPAPFK